MKKPYRYKAKVVKVIDGDTFDINVDLGFSIWTLQRLRLVNVNTPEIRGSERKDGLRVKRYVKELIEGKLLDVDIFKRGKYGRYVAEIYLEDGTELSKHLILNNMAKKVDW
jgi:micrococcal nuclease